MRLTVDEGRLTDLMELTDSGSAIVHQYVNRPPSIVDFTVNRPPSIVDFTFSA